MGQRHKHADVIVAWAEGKDVQVWNEGMSRWIDITSGQPNFMSDKYRIKPPAKKYRVALFISFDSDNETYAAIANSHEGSNAYEKSPRFIRWLTDWIEYEE